MAFVTILIGSAQIVGAILLLSGQIGIGITVFAGSHAVFLFGTLVPRSQLFGQVQCRLGEGSRDVWITIDDGPDPRTTPQLLAALERHKLKAAFFLIGERAAEYPELVRSIHDAGHAIGNHTHTHPAGRFWCIDPWAARREIARCDSAIQAITGETPTIFRSPVGHSNPFVHRAAAKAGKTVVAWSARGFDGVGTPKEKVVEKLLRDIAPGTIVVLHEGYDPAQRGYAPVDILEAILESRSALEFADS